MYLCVYIFRHIHKRRAEGTAQYIKCFTYPLHTQKDHQTETEAGEFETSSQSGQLKKDNIKKGWDGTIALWKGIARHNARPCVQLPAQNK